MAKIQRATPKVRAGRTTTPSTKTKTVNTSDDVLSRVTKPGDIQYLKGVFFGPPKTKKTINSCSSAEKTLLILTEPEGDLSVRDRPNVDVFRPESWKDLDQVTNALKGKDHGYSVAVYDSVTFMFELVAGADVAQAFREGKDVRRPYGNGGAAVNQIIWNATALDMNVMFTAQLKVENDSEDGTPLDPMEGEYPVSLAITPMVYKILTPAVSFIGRTFKKPGIAVAGNKARTKTVEYWVSFEDYGRSPASSRIEGFPEQVQDFNLDTLLAEIRKES